MFCFFILIMYILFCGTNQENMFQKEIKDLTFEVSDPSTCLYGPKIYDAHTERGWGGLEICHMFTDDIVSK